ncbi:transcriptional regulator, TetR family [Sanguibacter gelidistatuariae]|uniref:Transcriptional regulator, TetR family n=1 Tax=Sanguibacter gelidistatuariae TaxID=1814289 RepID=A0A1G6GRL9_9MICO|nr:transcriptional regulator, TetR family [Sanguibacter gelidistatuariae]
MRHHPTRSANSKQANDGSTVAESKRRRKTVLAQLGVKASKTSVDEVVKAAIALADEEGLEAVSMRRVADKLGISAMSLYTYVPGKAELIELMVDSIAAETPLEPHVGTVRARLENIARQQWAEFGRHPWLLQVDSSRPPLGPGVSDRYEWQLAAVEGLGLSDLEMDQTLTLLVSVVAGPARAARAAQRTNESSGMSDRGWWEINAPLLEKVMDGGRFPLSGRVGQNVGELYNGASASTLSFEFGLARVLDGIEQLIASK